MTDTERIEQLGGGVVVYVSQRHTFGTDAFLLSHFASPRHYDTACDLGCGCGIVPLLWFRSPAAPKKTFGLELQPEAVRLARQSAESSGLSDKITVLEGDLRNPPSELPRGAFDVITCNPPYKKLGTGIISSSQSDRIARHETACTLDDVCAAAARLLRFGGRLCISQLPERLPDAIHSMRAHRIEPKRLRFVHEEASKAPWLLLMEGKLGAKPFLQVEAPLLLFENGADSREITEVFHTYRKS